MEGSDTMKQILLVEDDLSLIGGLSFAVKKEGYGIEVARTCLEAETLWGSGHYDLRRTGSCLTAGMT